MNLDMNNYSIIFNWKQKYETLYYNHTWLIYVYLHNLFKLKLLE